MIASAALLGIACSAVLDGDRHRGGDGGPVPADGHVPDGGPDAAPSEDASGPDPCEEAPPTAVCGQPVDDVCPPILPDGFAGVFPHRTPLGVLRPTVVLEGEDAYARDIAAGSVPDLGGGHGTTVLLAMVEQTPGVYGPVRVDVPLNDFHAANRGPLPDPDPDNGADLADTAAVTSIAAQRLESTTSTGRVTLHLANSATGERWWGHADVSTTFETSLADGTAALDDVGTIHLGVVTRQAGSGTPSLIAAGIEEIFTGVTAELVPGDERLRMVGTTSQYLMLHDGDGGFWFWNALSIEQEVTSWAEGRQKGKAAWVHAADENHVLAWHDETDGVIAFNKFECTSDAPACEEPFLGANPSPVSTLAPTGEAPDGVGLADGRVAVLITERYSTGDRLVLQILEADLSSFSVPRIPVLDLRGTEERVTDARIGLVETDTASTLVVSVAVGDTSDAASRVVMTGLRACAD